MMTDYATGYSKSPMSIIFWYYFFKFIKGNITVFGVCALEIIAVIIANLTCHPEYLSPAAQSPILI